MTVDVVCCFKSDQDGTVVAAAAVDICKALVLPTTRRAILRASAKSDAMENNRRVCVERDDTASFRTSEKACDTEQKDNKRSSPVWTTSFASAMVDFSLTRLSKKTKQARWTDKANVLSFRLVYLTVHALLLYVSIDNGVLCLTVYPFISISTFSVLPFVRIQRTEPPSHV